MRPCSNEQLQWRNFCTNFIMELLCVLLIPPAIQTVVTSSTWWRCCSSILFASSRLRAQLGPAPPPTGTRFFSPLMQLRCWIPGLAPGRQWPVNPWHESSAFNLQLALSNRLSFGYLYPDQVAGHIPSVRFGVKDTDFHYLSDSQQTQYVLGLAIQEYVNTVTTYMAPPLVLAITEELNHDSLKPTSTQVKEAAAILAHSVQAFCALCPGLAPQFQQICHNRDKVLRITGDNCC